jgi:hypothetical protein
MRIFSVFERKPEGRKLLTIKMNDDQVTPIKGQAGEATSGMGGHIDRIKIVDRDSENGPFVSTGVVALPCRASGDCFDRDHPWFVTWVTTGDHGYLSWSILC